jgi:hypothetical protein
MSLDYPLGGGCRMTNRIRKFWLASAAALAVALAAFGGIAVPTSPARAQEWFGVHAGRFGFGFGEPYYPYYYQPYYSPYYHYYYPYGYRWGYPY